MTALDRLTQDAAAEERRARARLAARTRWAASPAPVLAGDLAPGRRVVDLVSGEEGTVIAGRTSHIVVPVAGGSGR